MVDVFLDKVFKISNSNKFTNIKDIKNKGYNCLINDSQSHISFENRIYFNNGMTIPTQMVLEENLNNNISYFRDRDSEYVIYNPKLLNIKYIIELENSY